MLPRTAIILALLVTSAAVPAAAEDSAVRVELNTAETTDTSCRLSFLVENTHANDIAQVVYETVLFDADGTVNQLTLFDFGTLPANRPRVRQFEVPDLACDGLSRILINGASTCEAGALGADICSATLDLNSRTAIALLG